MNRVTFSRKWTLVNILVSVMGMIPLAVLTYVQVQRWIDGPWSIDGYGSKLTNSDLAWFYILSYIRQFNSISLALIFMTIIFLPAIVGMIFTLLFMYLDSCCSCLCSACTPAPLQIGVLMLDDALVEYVEVRDAGGKKEIVKKTEWRERQKSQRQKSNSESSENLYLHTLYSSNQSVSKSEALPTGISEVEESVL
jgi:hypothetical protein